MESQACSGGYYVASPSNKIYANRNAWTGSIGVTMGTFYDVSGLLDKLGIKTQTITSGPNKAMGSMTEPMTDEQKEIFKGLIDQSYEQFVGVVAKTLTGMTKLGGLSMTGQYKQAMELIQNGGTSFSVMYMSQVRK